MTTGLLTCESINNLSNFCVKQEPDSKRTAGSSLQGVRVHFLSIKAQPTQLRCSCLTVSTCPVCSHTCARGVGASAGRLRSVVLLRRGGCLFSEKVRVRMIMVMVMVSVCVRRLLKVQHASRVREQSDQCGERKKKSPLLLL